MKELKRFIANFLIIVSLIALYIGVEKIVKFEYLVLVCLFHLMAENITKES